MQSLLKEVLFIFRCRIHTAKITIRAITFTALITFIFRISNEFSWNTRKILFEIISIGF